MEVLIRPGNHVLSLKPGEPLLPALRAQGLPISYSCEDGRCGLCRCKLLRGTVVESGRPPRPLFGCRTRYLLACQSSAAEDCAIEIPDAGEPVIHPPRRLRTQVLGIESITHNVRLLRLSNADKLLFSPGQFVELEFGRGLSRVYSLSGLPGDDELRFHIRIHPQGSASQLITERLQPGAMLRLRAPYGVAWLRRQQEGPMLLASAGTGLGPLLSVLRGIAAARLRNPVHVYTSFMSREDIYGLDELAAALAALPNLRASHLVVAYGQLKRGLRRGLLTEVLEADFSHFKNWQANLYGSPFAIDAAVHLLRRRGIDEDHLHADPFHPYGN
ncbi:2Fe-2S iron-sulfur cluster-binding protein [Nevskia ramosa]|uniref:2Fe-2S iron-sulfur cluster-binding protein n=1 Tax=Nevskia ramosa TaxID=64002 RepID=UPI003D0A5B40